MSRQPIIAALVLSSACMTIQANPPRSIADLEPAASIEERKEQMASHALSAAQRTTTTVRTGRHGSSVSRSTDLSLLAQDGNYYHLHDYLGELQKVGIAKEVENPLDHIGNLRGPALVMYGGSMSGLILGMFMAPLFESDCGDRPSYSDDTYSDWNRCDTDNNMSFVPAMLSGLGIGVGITIVGGIMYFQALKPIAKAKQQAARERSKWAREWNKTLMKKLSLKEAPSVTKGQ